MIERYTRPEMARIWSEENKYRQWLEVELAAAEALAQTNDVPPEAARLLRKHASFDLKRIQEIEREVKHDVIAFTTAVSESLAAAGEADASRWLHYGLTSNDVVDTAQALMVRSASDLILRGITDLAAVLEDARVRVQGYGANRKNARHARRADHVRTETGALVRRSAAQSHALFRRGGGHARRQDFGRRGNFRAHRPAGRRAHLPAAGIAAGGHRFAGHLAGPPRQLRRHAGAGGRRRSKRSRSRSGICSAPRCAKWRSRFRAGQKGSSAMPHKRNPVSCEQICGLARVVRGNVLPAFENIALWHERDISHSSVERVILPDTTTAVDYMLARTIWLISGLRVSPERMKRNLDLTRGLVFSGQLLLDLSAAGMLREEAYKLVQGYAMSAWESDGDFRSAIESDPIITKHLSPEALEDTFSVSRQLRNIDQIFQRVFPRMKATSVP